MALLQFVQRNTVCEGMFIVAFQPGPHGLGAFVLSEAEMPAVSPECGLLRAYANQFSVAISCNLLWYQQNHRHAQ